MIDEGKTAARLASGSGAGDYAALMGKRANAHPPFAGHPSSDAPRPIAKVAGQIHMKGKINRGMA